jgi:sugar phosphate isomerase/epimerase
MPLQRCDRVLEKSVRLSVVTEAFIDRSLDALMDWLDLHAPQVRGLEVATGGYSPPGHSPLDLPPATRGAWDAHIRERGFVVSALNVSGNPLHPDQAIAAVHDAHLRSAIELAAELGIDRVVAMSGCPAGAAGGTTTHFAANAWLPDYAGIAAWQWSERVRPYWDQTEALIERVHPQLMVCLELHPGAHVYNVDTFLRLRAVAPHVGVNLDPSHLFWQGMDPLRVIDRLGEMIGHSHGKDVRYHADELALNGLLDSRWPGDPASIPWDFAAIGHGEHPEEWWSSFADALDRRTSTIWLSIEHEDRLHDAESGLVAAIRPFASVDNAGAGPR